jgi:hypothetical protein
MGTQVEDRPADREFDFTSGITSDDEAMMRSYEAIVREATLDLTGRAVQQRLTRIEAEFKRIDEYKFQLGRLKSITKTAVLGAERTQ